MVSQTMSGREEVGDGGVEVWVVQARVEKTEIEVIVRAHVVLDLRKHFVSLNAKCGDTFRPLAAK